MAPEPSAGPAVPSAPQNACMATPHPSQPCKSDVLKALHILHSGAHTVVECVAHHFPPALRGSGHHYHFLVARALVCAAPVQHREVTSSCCSRAGGGVPSARAIPAPQPPELLQLTGRSRDCARTIVGCVITALTYGRIDVSRYVMRKASQEYRSIADFTTVTNVADKIALMRRVLQVPDGSGPYLAVAFAAAVGDAAAVEWFSGQGHSGYPFMCTVAVACNQMHMLRVLREHNCGWDVHTTTALCKKGHIDELLSAVEQGCPVMDDVLYSSIVTAMRRGKDALANALLMACPRHDITHVLALATRHMRISFLRQRLADTPLLIATVSVCRHVGALKWLLAARDTPQLAQDVVEYVAEHGHTGILVWMLSEHLNGLSEKVRTHLIAVAWGFAAAVGNTNMLAALKRCKCEVNIALCLACAVLGGHDAAAEWVLAEYAASSAVANSCEVLCSAVAGEHEEVVRWLHNNGHCTCNAGVRRSGRIARLSRK
ncbi:hypothetical protein JKP88DRAFT_253138 [Tribonema minus]|uniref:Ankyrin repeat protein n=1 Tax=Tribonema minus TaxID=303371 RepID=A0A836CKT1_9STRA|nr:hypothetical protein JKP88DRAFT_253138 [Tribonema minus]